jgi:N-acyl-D-aspartate/D-glutamate deacylase
MHDIVIRGGTIIDGTGKAAFAGDVAIADGRIVGVGGKQGPAKRDIDADGLLVTPAGSTRTLIMTARRCGTRCWRRRVGMA